MPCRIEVQGRLDRKWAAVFDGMRICTETVGDGLTITALCGAISDQAHLHGMLGHIRDLGLPLLSVQLLDSD
jgi:hypothetical protein